jgi:hypothetical protein
MNKKEKQKTKKAVSRLWFSTAEVIHPLSPSSLLPSSPPPRLSAGNCSHVRLRVSVCARVCVRRSGRQELT